VKLRKITVSRGVATVWKGQQKPRRDAGWEAQLTSQILPTADSFFNSLSTDSTYSRTSHFLGISQEILVGKSDSEITDFVSSENLNSISQSTVNRTVSTQHYFLILFGSVW